MEDSASAASRTSGSLSGQPTVAHVAFAAGDHAAVDAFYEAAIAAGGEDNGPPGPGRTTTRTITRGSSTIRTATTSRPSATGRNEPGGRPSGSARRRRPTTRPCRMSSGRRGGRRRGDHGDHRCRPPEARREDGRAARVQAHRPRRHRLHDREGPSGHGLGYTKIKNAFGEDGTRIYAEANQAGLERIARFVEEDGIDCNFERKDNYVYADDEQQANQVRQESRGGAGRGLPASLVRETPLPFPVPAAVRLEPGPVPSAQVAARLAATIPARRQPRLRELSRVTRSGTASRARWSWPRAECGLAMRSSPRICRSSTAGSSSPRPTRT